MNVELAFFLSQTRPQCSCRKITRTVFLLKVTFSVNEINGQGTRGYKYSGRFFSDGSRQHNEDHFYSFSNRLLTRFAEAGREGWVGQFFPAQKFFFVTKRFVWIFQKVVKCISLLFYAVHDFFFFYKSFAGMFVFAHTLPSEVKWSVCRAKALDEGTTYVANLRNTEV